jgi:hypothetical protein
MKDFEWIETIMTPMEIEPGVDYIFNNVHIQNLDDIRRKFNELWGHDHIENILITFEHHYINLFNNERINEYMGFGNLISIRVTWKQGDQYKNDIIETGWNYNGRYSVVGRDISEFLNSKLKA